MRAAPGNNRGKPVVENPDNPVNPRLKRQKMPYWRCMQHTASVLSEGFQAVAASTQSGQWLILHSGMAVRMGHFVGGYRSDKTSRPLACHQARRAANLGKEFSCEHGSPH
ncbi:MAG: hypothetical protein U1E47_02995 [Rivihabitans pingtungensis]